MQTLEHEQFMLAVDKKFLCKHAFTVFTYKVLRDGKFFFP